MSNFSNNRNTVGTTGQGDSKFASTVHNDIQKSTFFRDQVVKTTYNAGQLIPIYVDEVLPGDTHEIDIAHITRLSTPLFPTMDEIELDFYFFFVPNRIVWDGWQELNGENTMSAWVPSTQPSLVPTIGVENPDTIVEAGTIMDYYGIPTGIKLGINTTALSCLPFRGYLSIWNRWFRDQNLQAPMILDTTDNNMSVLQCNIPPLKVNKKHDYFSSALPQASKAFANTSASAIRLPKFLDTAQTFPTLGANLGRQILTSQTYASVGDFDNDVNMIQALRTATQLNKLLERDARGGTRYVEMLKSHFNVEAEDYRLQYPEFLGTHHTVIGMSQVPQTSSTDDTSPQGNLAAFAMSAGKAHGFKKSFVEHGYIHGFVVARQRKTYQQGIERFWLRRDRFDFYYPELAHITEQPIYMSEIFADGDVSEQINFTRVFGFQEAWADYRYKPNRVSGQFRSNHTNSLAPWHYADYYASAPALTASWIQDNSAINIDRTLSVSSEVNDQFIMDCKIINKTTRPLPMYSIPGMLDHF